MSTITLAARSVMNPDYDNGEDVDIYQNDEKKKNTDHVKKGGKNRGELAMAEWGKKNKLLTA